MAFMSKACSIFVCFLTFLISSDLWSAPPYTKDKQWNRNERSLAPNPRTKEYKVNGIGAWSEAKKYGFEFFPNAPRGVRDGGDTRGPSFYTNQPRKIYWQDGAHIVGGVNMILYPAEKTSIIPGVKKNKVESYATFNLFANKRLADGWKIKRMVITGSYRWEREPRSGGNSAYAKVKLVNYSTSKRATKAQLKEIVLIGPTGKRWQDAFRVSN